MTDIAIHAENIGKQYRIGGRQEKYRTLRDTISNSFSVPIRRLRSVLQGQSTSVSNETIWALKEVSFDIKQGEVVGIIGRNGAGKSTLLKILSQITEPTEGYAKIRGRIGSLLEVGTGFHPELTGKENIFLNGAILGMKKKEIKHKFDEIVSFAEMEKFIYTPVKHYSSGMYMRLAFAVAAYLETEVLMVDEVLAVGDLAFQNRCLGKMREIGKSGRCILFVSHNLTAIRELCSRCILLSNGKIDIDGTANKAIETYIRSGMVLSDEIFIDSEMHNVHRGLDKFKFTYAALRNKDSKTCSQISYGDPFELIIHGESTKNIDDLLIGFSVFREEGQKLFMSVQKDSGLSTNISGGSIRLHCCIEPNLLLPGRYWINLGAKSTNVSLNVQQVLHFDIVTFSENHNEQIESYREGFLRHPVMWKYA